MTDFTALRARYLRQPHEVSIETWALCNAACTFCPYPSLERKGAKLPDAVIFDLIEQMSSWKEPFFISPFKVNEPLLDDRLSGICQRIVEFVPRASIRLFTNGSPLTHKQIDWIAKLPSERLAHLWVSLNSTDAQEYGELMKLSYSITSTRLDVLHRLKERGEFPHHVMLSRVVSTPDLSEGLSSADKRFVSECRQRWPLFPVHLIPRSGWLGYVSPSTLEIPQSPCARWFEMSITATGQCALCCMDGTGEFAVGSIVETALKEKRALLDLYNHPELLRRREFAVTRAGIEPCRRCTY